MPQSADRKHDYIALFKDAVTIVRKYFCLFCNDSPERLFAELLCFTRPVQSGRADKRNMKPKPVGRFCHII